MKKIKLAKNIMYVTAIMVISKWILGGINQPWSNVISSILNILVNIGILASLYFYFLPIVKFIEIKIGEWEKTNQKNL